METIIVTIVNDAEKINMDLRCDSNISKIYSECADKFNVNDCWFDLYCDDSILQNDNSCIGTTNITNGCEIYFKRNEKYTKMFEVFQILGKTHDFSKKMDGKTAHGMLLEFLDMFCEDGDKLCYYMELILSCEWYDINMDF